VAFVENRAEAAQAASTRTCEVILSFDPSVDDPRFDGFGGKHATPHAGKATGGSESLLILEAIAVQSEKDRIDGTPGDDNFAGKVLGDSINGRDGNDTIRGGDNELRGDDGNDGVFGDRGNDLLFGDAGDDAIVGGADNDDVQARPSRWPAIRPTASAALSSAAT